MTGKSQYSLELEMYTLATKLLSTMYSFYFSVLGINRGPTNAVYEHGQIAQYPVNFHLIPKQPSCV